MKNIIKSLFILSWICQAAVWVYSFVVIIGYLGWFAIILLLLFKAVTPIAIIGLFFKGQWANCAYILIGLLLAYGMRFYAFWLENLYNKKQQAQTDFIDVESRTL